MNYHDAIHIVVKAAEAWAGQLEDRAEQGPEGCEVYILPELKRIKNAIARVDNEHAKTKS